MKEIFSYNFDINKTAYINWRTYHHQPMNDMVVIADGYMESALILAKECLEDNTDKKYGC